MDKRAVMGRWIIVSIICAVGGSDKHAYFEAEILVSIPPRRLISGSGLNLVGGGYMRLFREDTSPRFFVLQQF